MTANTADGVDILVVGSGLGGMIAALRAHDSGLRTLMIEKSPYYGGTSAFSGGGIWIPNHPDVQDEDSREAALTYLNAVTGGKADQGKLEAYVDNAPAMAAYARSVGARLFKCEGLPDYFSDLPGAMPGRQLSPRDFDGKLLGDEFHRLRPIHPGFLGFERYALNMDAIYALMNRQRGWLWEGCKLVFGYWADIGWRMRTSRDRRLSMGRAFVGYLRKAMIDRGIPLLLNTALVGLVREESRVTGVRVKHNGNEKLITSRAVILATGGFEQNQQLRDEYHPVKTEVVHSLTPAGGNRGDAIRAGQEIGAAVDNMENAWWSPTVDLLDSSNSRVAGQLFFDRGRPGSICVNRLGRRFCNESISYDRFGYAMIEDHRKTGANLPCWMIFDARYRQKYNISNIPPGWAYPDWRLPKEYWDSILYRAGTLEELARKIEIDPHALAATIRRVNEYAHTGRDMDFGRGDTEFDRFFGDPRNRPNPALGAIDKAPFYAIKLELGDLGTKGGLRVDEHGRVIDQSGEPITGLYATGNTIASLFADSYPGPGSTLGPAMTFGFVSANHAADSLANAGGRGMACARTGADLTGG